MSQDANKSASTAYDVTRSMTRVHGIDLHHVLEGDTKRPTLVLINMASHNPVSYTHLTLPTTD